MTPLPLGSGPSGGGVGGVVVGGEGAVWRSVQLQPVQAEHSSGPGHFPFPGEKRERETEKAKKKSRKKPSTAGRLIQHSVCERERASWLTFPTKHPIGCHSQTLWKCISMFGADQ